MYQTQDKNSMKIQILNTQHSTLLSFLADGLCKTFKRQKLVGINQRQYTVDRNGI